MGLDALGFGIGWIRLWDSVDWVLGWGTLKDYRFGIGIGFGLGFGSYHISVPGNIWTAWSMKER